MSFHWTGTDWTVVVSVASALIVKAGSEWAWLKKHEPKFVEKLPQGIKNVVDTVAHWGADLAKTPWFAAEAAKGQVELHHVIDKVSHLTIVNEAKTVLMSIGKDFSNLTPAELVKAEYLLRLALSAFRVNLTDQQVKDVFTEAQKAIDMLRGTKEYQAAFPTEPVAPAQPAQLATPQQTA